MSVIELITSYKLKGNSSFSEGNYVAACKYYANGIEEMMKIESNGDQNVIDDIDFVIFKSQLFLNLALANFQLDEISGCRKCCNTCLIFCRDPFLKLDCLGIDDDLNFDVQILGPILPQFYKTAAKALYRRSLCKKTTKDIIGALEDLNLANYYVPSDNIILKEISRIQADHAELLNPEYQICHNNTAPSINLNEQKRFETHRNTISFQSEYFTPSDILYMTSNGGPCLLRKGFWSQSINETKVYLPIYKIFKEMDHMIKISKKDFKIKIGVRDIEIHYKTIDGVISEYLEYNILPSESFWMLESPSSNENCSLIVLYLFKAEPYEKFPGCEWWDRVFKNDEAIDTLTCKVENYNDLPQHAIEKSHREHHRFTNLPKLSQKNELDHLANLKKSFIESELRTRQAANEEDTAVEEVPQRAEMLESLRKEFPRIDFTSKSSK